MAEAAQSLWSRTLERARALLEPIGAVLQYQRAGILGMNRRNICYISRYNSRELFPLVDNKLHTKKMAMEHGLRVPRLIATVETQGQVSRLSELIRGEAGFCIKPAKGSGGKGILVVTGVSEAGYVRANGQQLSLQELQRHVSNVLAGLFSLGGAADQAIIESLLALDERLRPYSHEGVPDLRVIVFRGIPVMAMMRLSCSASKGKANLHQGAVGVGIDIATGAAVNAVQKDRPIQLHPDTGHNLLELVIPNWQQLLELACACYDMTGLGYLGVDLVLDHENGPTMLELNARPGLSIQIANASGLLPRLQQVEKLHRTERMSLRERVAFAQEKFASSI